MQAGGDQAGGSTQVSAHRPTQGPSAHPMTAVHPFSSLCVGWPLFLEARASL